MIRTMLKLDYYRKIARLTQRPNPFQFVCYWFQRFSIKRPLKCRSNLQQLPNIIRYLNSRYFSWFLATFYKTQMINIVP